jgi:hypothetical protein
LNLKVTLRNSSHVFLKKEQIKILELKTAIAKIKEWTDKCNRRFNIPEDKSSKLESKLEGNTLSGTCTGNKCKLRKCMWDVENMFYFTKIKHVFNWSPKGDIKKNKVKQ